MPGEQPAVSEGAAITETPAVPIEVALTAASTLEPTAEWHDVVAATEPIADNRSFLARAVDDLQAVAADIQRLTGSLSVDHATRLESAVQAVVDAATHPAIVKAAEKVAPPV
jgi:hypothetical protein